MLKNSVFALLGAFAASLAQAEPLPWNPFTGNKPVFPPPGATYHEHCAMRAKIVLGPDAGKEDYYGSLAVSVVNLRPFAVTFSPGYETRRSQKVKVQLLEALTPQAVAAYSERISAYGLLPEQVKFVDHVAIMDALVARTGERLHASFHVLRNAYGRRIGAGGNIGSSGPTTSFICR